MKTTLSPRKNRYLAILSISLIMAALVAGTAGCDGYVPSPSEDLEIRTWYDLDDVRDNLAGHHVLMNDLNSTTPGYQELASPTANGGQGWQPIGRGAWTTGPRLFGEVFKGSFDGQGHEIHDLFISGIGAGEAGLLAVLTREESSGISAWSTQL